MNKTLRFEMRIAEDTLEQLNAIKADYEKRFNKKFSLAKTIEYTIAIKYLDTRKEE